MDSLTIRHLPHAVAGGARNMAADESLLHSAVNGVASFRTYGWCEPTVTLGYFQSRSSIDVQPQLARLPIVRRPTGGMTLVHHHELTYALALPEVAVGRRSSVWLARIHEIVASALINFGVSASVAEDTGNRSEDVLCFHHVTPGDLLLGRHKIGGSAQRRQRGALLQHGGILLAASPLTPSLPGIEDDAGQTIAKRELESAIVDQLSQKMNWSIDTAAWTTEEIERTGELERRKYQSDGWNWKR